MDNRYAPPQAKVDDIAPAGGVITPTMIDALRGTRAWVLLFGILLLIGSAFMILGGVMMIFGGALVAGEAETGMVTGMGVAYLLFAVLYIFPAIHLVRYSSAISRLTTSGAAQDMEDALNHQRKFWRFVGVIAVVMIVLMVVGMVAAVLIPVLAQMG